MIAQNQTEILEEWALIRSKKQEPSSLFYRVLDRAKSYLFWLAMTDLYLIAEILDYSVLWVYEKAEKVDPLVNDWDSSSIPDFDLPL